MTDQLFNITFGIIWTIIFCIWLYCIWFANRYDKNTNSIIWLFVLNAFYIPFYLWRIKQIKLELKIREENLNHHDKINLSDEDFINQNRNGIIDILDLWTSNEKLIELLESDPEINLPKELFQQWKDSYEIDINILRKAFSSTELDLLAKFDKTVYDNFENLNNSKQIDFWKTNEWKELNTDATEILKKLNEK